jgi:hypothetical protein
MHTFSTASVALDGAPLWVLSAASYYLTLMASPITEQFHMTVQGRT